MTLPEFLRETQAAVRSQMRDGALYEELVFCGRCKTPHHRECWLYAGRCSVFGCGETQFRVPQRARRTGNLRR